MKMLFPKISVVMPSYNQEQFIEESILSVINQNYPNLEFIIIDGGSTDKTLEIIRKYKDKIDFWVSEKDRGQTHAINKGFKKATGEIITWLCSDDTYNPDTLKFVGDFFYNNPKTDFLYGDVNAIDENNNVLRSLKSLKLNKIAFLTRIGTIPQPSSFYKYAVIDKIGLLDEKLYYAMDHDFFLRIIFGDFKIEKIKKALANYRYHLKSKTVKAKHQECKKNREAEFSVLNEKYFDKMGYSKSTIKIVSSYFYLKKKIFNIDRYWKYKQYYVRKIV